jgi:hypothetical protein
LEVCQGQGEEKVNTVSVRCGTAEGTAQDVRTRAEQCRPGTEGGAAGAPSSSADTSAANKSTAGQGGGRCVKAGVRGVRMLQNCWRPQLR